MLLSLWLNGSGTKLAVFTAVLTSLNQSLSIVNYSNAFVAKVGGLPLVK